MLATGLGVLVNTIHSATNTLTVTLLEVVVLGIGTLLSFAFFVRHLDLDGEYRASLVAMSVIKEFYIERLAPHVPGIEAAFSRRLAEVPRRRAFGRGAAVMSGTMALLGGLAAVGTVGQARQLWAIATSQSAPYLDEVRLLGHGIPYAWELLAGGVALLIQLGYARLVTRGRSG